MSKDKIKIVASEYNENFFVEFKVKWGYADKYLYVGCLGTTGDVESDMFLGILNFLNVYMYEMRLKINTRNNLHIEYGEDYREIETEVYNVNGSTLEVIVDSYGIEDKNTRLEDLVGFLNGLNSNIEIELIR